MKKIISLLLTLLMCLSLGACGNTDKEKAIMIVYTNDTHSYVNNQIKQDDGTYVDGLNFGSVKALKDDLVSAGNRVILVDAGDETQGTPYGSYDDGASVIEIMNATTYDLATIGNHEFDYGFETFEKNLSSANFDYVCANLYNVQTNEPYIDAYKIIENDGVKVGFIGVTTPDTMEDVRSSTFEDENGDQLYTFIGFDDQQALYDLVQSKIDEISKEVDYVVVLGHLGVDESSTVTSYELIENTHGIDLLIDGHSHTVMESESVQDNEGNDVVLTQTGSYLANIGVATLSKSEGINTVLMSEYDRSDEEVQALADELVAKVEAQMGEVVANNECNLTIYDTDGTTRIVRTKETAISDFVADSYYYYMLEQAGLNCDVALINGGGVRTNYNQGLITLLDVNMVSPFGNTLELCKIKGSDLLQFFCDLYADYGAKDESGNATEMADSMYAAGMKFDVSMSASENRVSNMQVYNKDTNEYESLDLDKEYYIAGSDYVLGKTEQYPELANMEVVATYITTDYLATSSYVQNFALGEDGLPTITSANSPLAKYTNYLMDYENYLGSGRVSEVE